MSIKIISTGRSVPNKILTNDEIAKMVDTNDEWILSRTGIKERHIATSETLIDLAYNAGMDAITSANFSKENIDMVICATIGCEYFAPSLACSVIEKLGIDVTAFDINAGCSGFIYATDIASKFIQSKSVNNILIISAEMMSKYTNWEDRGTCVLFGDGAGAVLVTKGDNLKYINLTAKGDTKMLTIKAGNLNSPFMEKSANGFLEMNGQDVFKFAVTTVDAEIKKALDKTGLKASDIDYYLLHQANKRIIKAIRMKLKEGSEKFPVNIERYGNMSSATIPILLDEMNEEGKLKPGMKILLSAFGAGLTTGSAIIEWQ